MKFGTLLEDYSEQEISLQQRNTLETSDVLIAYKEIIILSLVNER